MNAQGKRPYVRPRIGHSVLRSLWYLFAFVGIIVVAFLLPRNPPPMLAVDGSWDLRAERAVGDIPAGQVRFLATGGRYAFSFEASAQDGAAGMEMGELREDDGRLIMQPLERTQRDANGRWIQTVPPPRSLSVLVQNEKLTLTGPGGATLSGARRETTY
jgi:hypothetical protein